ncbi:MAG: DNA polymerase IV, partial [Rhodospirillales bacterium]
MPILCRDCAIPIDQSLKLSECPECGSTRLIEHEELNSLSTAHVDCDAFFASVEKRDDPSIRGKEVIVGGGKRGVVAACCYVARIKGVRSAMPMFEALKRCPNAVIIPPNMEKYKIVGMQVRALMTETTPQIEPISIDEAFLDLSGTEKLHKATPAQTLIKLIKRIENEVGISASIGLSFNKFLAKIASDLDKPRGFSIIGQSKAMEFLTDKPVGLLWGVGKVLQKKMAKDGIDTIGQL